MHSYVRKQQIRVFWFPKGKFLTSQCINKLDFQIACSLHISIKDICMKHLHMQKCGEALFCCCVRTERFTRTILSMVLAKMLVAGKSDGHQARQKLCSLSKSRKKFGPWSNSVQVSTFNRFPIWFLKEKSEKERKQKRWKEREKSVACQRQYYHRTSLWASHGPKYRIPSSASHDDNNWYEN